MGLVSNKKKRACIVGLDGVPIALLIRLAENGTMPAVKKLLSEGHLYPLKASLPEISSVSWTNFMTGVNPGEHGIFGFTDFREHSYEIRFPNFLDLKAPTVWDRIGAMGLKSIVINQPSTYPARHIEGVLVSGFVAINLARAVHPLSHLAALENMNYRIDIDTERARRDHDFFWRELDSNLICGRQALDHFWEQDWDLFEFVVTGTDRLHHYFWNALEDPDNPEHSRCLDYYQKVDAIIERIVGQYEGMCGSLRGLFLLSDHGFTGIQQEVYLNSFLERSGYLKFDQPAPRRLGDLAPGTLAFALDPNRVYLNLKGRFPRGAVETRDKNALKAEISAALKSMEYQGKAVVREIFDADEIYAGPFAAKGPDLIVLAQNGFDMKASLGCSDLFGRTDLQGMHTWDDAFLWMSKPGSSDLSISDVAGMILEEFA